MEIKKNIKIIKIQFTLLYLIAAAAFVISHRMNLELAWGMIIAYAGTIIGVDCPLRGNLRIINK